MIKEEQQLPEWFNGELYEEGETVQNRFSGEEYELNNVELSMYDFVMGSTILVEMGGGGPNMIKILICVFILYTLLIVLYNYAGKKNRK